MLAAVAYRPLPRRLVATAVLRRHLSYSRALFVSPSPDANQTTVTATSPLPSENPPPSPPDTLLTFPLNPSKDSILQNTFYQRKLPSELVHFSSREGKALFREAMDLGHAEGFFNLTGNFTMQSEPAYCGPSSLAMVLNALEVDPKQRWKGNWRWYSDELLDCCSPKEDVKKNGITFDQFACLAKCHCDVTVKRASTTSYSEFLQDLSLVTSRLDMHMVVSFSRASLGQTGDGHFSPIGGYHPLRNTALVMDVARFKYPSYWSDAQQLYEAMKPTDGKTGRGRGYFLLSHDGGAKVSLCAVNKEAAEAPTRLNWATLAHTFCADIPRNMLNERPQTLEAVVEVVLRNVPREYGVVLAMRQGISSSSSSSEDSDGRARLTTLLRDTSVTPLYPVVASAMGLPPSPTTTPDHRVAFATLFVLASPPALYASLPRELLCTLEEYRRPEGMTPEMAGEVARISEEIRGLMGAFCTCGTRAKMEGKGEVEVKELCSEDEHR